MQLLLESHEREWLSFGALASAAIHVTLLGLFVAAYRAEPERPGFVEQFVTYLVPPDKPVRQEGIREQLAWTGTRETVGVGDEPSTPEGTGPLVTGSSERKDSLPAEEPPSDPVAELLAESDVLTEMEVDSAVRRHPESAAPEYPRSMLSRNLEGSVFAVFVVDSTGFVDTTSFRVIRATHRDFVQAIRAALPGMRFRPALLGGRPVRQLVEQPFTFKITPPDSTQRRPPTEDLRLRTRDSVVPMLLKS
jgi:Gram-negative bacterial TonB protein C-terminal